MWDIKPLPIPGAFLMQLPKFSDNRGSFIKTFHADTFIQNGIEFQLKESFFSVSNKDVIRGMHFQNPPYDHDKIVLCPQGSILDVIVDLRTSSPTYKQHYAHVLSAENHLAFFIPKGLAHGFKSLEDNAITYYLVSSVHEPSADNGVLYNSCGIEWNCTNPIVSQRDLQFPALADFKSLFK
jgi:dTDP-4-dehydrorhamnose 3,5-epimerase